MIKESSCTTILVGKKASLNGSTLIARNEDGEIAQIHNVLLLFLQKINLLLIKRLKAI